VTISLEALRLSREIPGLDAEDYTRAAASPIAPPVDLELEVLPEDEVVAAYILMTWYWREAPTEDGDIHYALYVARKFRIGFTEAWQQMENAYGDYNSHYSHN
jgi:hypothetical protein